MTLLVLAAIGVAVSFGSIAGLLASVLVPAFVFRQQTRFRAGAAAVLYYASALWAIVPVARAFLSPDASMIIPILLWFSAAVLLASPWAMCWSQHWVCTRVLIALALSTVPPIGLIGVASPLLAAGYLFPGTGSFGIAAIAVLAADSVTSARRAAVAGITAAVLANVLLVPNLAPPQGWIGISTRFQTNKGDLLSAYTQDQELRRLATAEPARVIVFPESVVREWTAATDEFWADTINTLRYSGRTMLIGATVPVSTRYLNVLIARGSESKIFQQRVPVPVGMWHPFKNSAVPMNVFSRGTFDLAHERVAVLVCYEQLLVWPVLAGSFEHPTLLVGVSNLADLPVRNVGQCQRTALRSWSRLFALPLVTAVNSPR